MKARINKQVLQNSGNSDGRIVPKLNREIVSLTDGQLLRKFVEEKSLVAFEQMVQRHEKKVMAVCQNVCSCRHDAEDAFQATFLAALIHAKRLQKVRIHAAWFCRVAYNAALKIQLQKRNRHAAVEKMAQDRPAPEPTPEAWQIIAKRESTDQLLRQLFELPPKYQDCLVMFYFQRMNRSEIAERMGVTVSAVKGMLDRARALLKTKLINQRTSIPLVVPGGLLLGNARSIAVDDTLRRSAIEHGVNLCAGNSQMVPASLQLLAHAAGATRTGMSMLWYWVSGIAGIGMLIGIGWTGSALIHTDHGNADIQFSNPLQRPAQQQIVLQGQWSQRDQLQTRLNEMNEDNQRDQQRIAKLEGWISHKSEALKTSQSQQERQFLVRMIGEMSEESTELRAAIAKRNDEIKTVQNQLMAIEP